MRAKPTEPYPETLRRVWVAITGPPGRPYLALFGRLREDGEQQLCPDFRREATIDWLAPLCDSLDGV